MRLFTLVLISLLGACAKSEESDPKLHQQFLENAEGSNIRNVSVTSRLAVDDLYQDDFVDVLYLTLDSQQRGSDIVNGGYVAIKGGSNPNGRGFASVEELMAFERDNYVKAIGLSRPISYSDGEFIVDRAPETLGEKEFKVADFKVNYGGKNNRVNVRNWYYRITDHQSVILRVLCRFPLEELWQEQIDAIKETLNSVVLVEEAPKQILPSAEVDDGAIQ